MKQWSRKHHRCVLCSGTDRKHYAFGLCSACYLQVYKADPKIYSRVEDSKKRWRRQNWSRVQALTKATRERANFDGMRDAILERDNHACKQCGSTENLIVHHKDGKGRNQPEKNNDPSNLVTLCKACHMEEHRAELYAARKANGYRRRSGLKYKSRKTS